MKILYSSTINKSGKIYSFDVAKSGDEEFYLVITEGKEDSPRSEQYQVIIFDENLNDFTSSLHQALAKLKELKNHKPATSKTYSVEDVRQTHKQAYAPWTVQDDNRLTDLFGKGKSVSELARLFERNEGAINSRIRKLDLQAKQRQ